jgi:enoyl-CoA hydratase/carnithine racemase
MTDKIIAEVEKGVGWLTFNNPERRNAVSLEMAERVVEVMNEFVANDAVRVVVLKGAGGKSFVSGADISEFEKRRSDADKAHGYERNSLGMYEVVRDCPKPTVAMIQGYCMGGGMALACACDIRISAMDGIFAIPAARLGIGYRANFTRWVVETVGAPTTKEILFTGRRYPAEEALRLGLVNRVVPVDELETYVRDYVGSIVENAPLSVRAAKSIVNEVVKSPSDWNVERCAELVKTCSDSADFAEGRRAFMEKRTPMFQGR